MEKSTLFISEVGYLFDEIILLVGNNRSVRYCNKEVRHYFGADNKLFHEASGKNPPQHELQISPYLYDLAQTAASDKARFQTISVNATGEKITIEWKTIQLPPETTEGSTSILLIGKDISDECRKNEKIDDLEIQLNSVIEIMAGNYWWKDIHGVYKGFNHALLNHLGVTREEVVGHTDYDLPWANTADELVKNDQLVITSGLPYKTEEKIRSASGEIRIFDIFKIPLKNRRGEIIGTIGNSIDITERKQDEAKVKKHTEEAQRLKLENERQQIALLKEQEKLITLAHKVAHDIASPLSALDMVVQLCDELPENKRSLLKRASASILDIANNLINSYRTNDKVISPDIEPRQHLLVSDLLIQLLSEKKVQYSNLPVTFHGVIASDAHFVFIRMQPTEFRRAISNLINNAVDAMENPNHGQITVQLTTDAYAVVVEIQDNGKGMSSAMIEKMQSGESFTEGKENGHGLGLQQVWDTLEYNLGAMKVQSALGKGTSLQLNFPRIAASKWIAQDIHLIPENIIVILDDDTSIHTAWNLRFTPLLTSYPALQIHHFTQGQQVLDFLATLSPEEKNRVIFLSDYELLHQSRNGLQIVEASEIKHPMLVTSYYSNPKIRAEIDRLGIKILPKQMASVIPIYIDSAIADA